MIIKLHDDLQETYQGLLMNSIKIPAIDVA